MRRNIVECDRCKREIKKGEKVVQTRIGDVDKDFCGSCSGKLQEFLAGRDLEVPP